MGDDLTPEELQKLAAAFKEMGVKPKCDTPQDLKNWMKTFCESADDREERPARQENPVGDLPPRGMTYAHPQLRISSFSGEASKGDVAYDVWHFEIDCLLADGTHSKGQIMQAARKSLKGEASGIAMRLGPTATIEELLSKLEGAYGTVEMSETLMSQFYSTEQAEDETVTAWSCRLEGILDKARAHGKVNPEDSEEIMRSKFWTGLHEQLKNSSRHKFDTVKSYDQLKIQIRAVEHELHATRAKDPMQQKSHKQTKGQVKAALATADSTDMQELKGMIQSLTSKVEAVDKELQALKKPNPKPRMDKPAATKDAAPADNPQPTTDGKNPRGCWHCGKTGHIKRNCKLLMEQIQQFEQHQQQHLNMMGPPSWGGWPRPSSPAQGPHQPQYLNSWWENQPRPQSK